MSNKTDEEVDLLDLIIVLWNNKWIICLFIIFSFSGGMIFTYFKIPKYESKIIISVETIPPDYKNQKVISDFKKLFYSSNVFENWKKNNENSIINFKDFGNTKLLNGILISTKHENNLISFSSSRKSKHSITVNTNQLKIVNEFFKYCNYVNDLLKSRYFNNVNEALKLEIIRLNKIKTKANILNLPNSEYSNFLIMMKNDYDVIFIEPPTMPKKTSPRSLLIAVISLVIGGISGLLFVLFNNMLQKMNLRNQTKRN